MKILNAALLLIVACSLPARAAPTRYKLNDICKFDLEQYCKNINKRFTKQLRDCLAKQEKNLLPRCQDHYKEAH